MSVEHGPAFVAVVGPPGVGKSTITGALADHVGVQVFRLREFAYGFHARSSIDQRLFRHRRPLGLASRRHRRLADPGRVPGWQFPARLMVVLENFPGSLTQLRLLNEVAAQLRAPLAIVELTADNGRLSARVRSRRVCLTCEPDPRGDPHRPASPAALHPDRCANCGGALTLRQSDEPQRFAAGLARFHSCIPAIRQAVTALHLPYHVVDTTDDPANCLHRLTTALAARKRMNVCQANTCLQRLIEHRVLP